MASVSSAVRTAIVNANISGVTTKVFRDIAPDSTAYPFITIEDDLDRTPSLQGDAVVLARNKTMNVSLWQNLDSEDVDLIESLMTAVDGVNLSGADKTIFRCRVANVNRRAEVPDNVCHHSLVVTVTHSN